MPRHVPGAESQRAHQRLQATVWTPATETLLDRVGVSRGWRCADLGCGAVGILPQLSRRVGSEGRVVGVERDADLVASARAMATEEGLANVEVVEGDLFEAPLPPASFELVHVRFVLHLSEPERAIERMAGLARPGGFVAAQEPDLRSWRFEPSTPAWTSLLELLRAAIARDVDPDVGRRAPAMLARAGLADVESRAETLVLRDRHPYMRLPLAWAAAQRGAILEAGWATEEELDERIAELERHLLDRNPIAITATTFQAWGRKA